MELTLRIVCPGALKRGLRAAARGLRVWTDDYSNLFQILK